MTITMDADEGAACWSELLAEIEAGNDVIIARGTQLVARVARLPQPSSDDVDAARAALRENGKQFAPVTIDEVIEWKNEGRRQCRLSLMHPWRQLGSSLANILTAQKPCFRVSRLRAPEFPVAQRPT